MNTKYKLRNEKNYLFVKETTRDSIIADTYMWFLPMGAFYFNYHFIGGSYFVNFIILLVMIAIMSSIFKKVKWFKTKRELIKYLTNIEK